MKEAEKVRTKLLAEANSLKVARTKSTVGALLDRWLAQHEVDPSTRMNYESQIRNYIKPNLGGVPLVLLPGPELFAWLALRRVTRGGVARFEGRYYDYGRPIPGYLVPGVLDSLVEQELVVVMGQVDMVDGLARLCVTEAGQARYLELARKQRNPRVPLPEHPHPVNVTSFSAGCDVGAVESPAGHRSSAAPLHAPAGDQPGRAEQGRPPGWWSRERTLDHGGESP